MRLVCATRENNDHCITLLIELTQLISRRPPRCALIPYTTLFRSGQHAQVRAGDLPARAVEEPERGLPALPADSAGREVARDRKSTRLNSSHVKISYAVFCLKKKNTITPYTRVTAGALSIYRISTD